MQISNKNNRILVHKEVDKIGECVIYVMSRDQRVQDNHALVEAQKYSLEHKLPLAVVFCLREKVGFRAREHYEFMLEGLKGVEKSLSEKNIPFLMLIGDPIDRLQGLFHHTNPQAVFFDFSPIRGHKKLIREVTSTHNFSIYEVDTHNCVPVWVSSNKQEFAAYTIRPKIHRLIGQYLVEPEQIVQHLYNWPGKVMKINELEGQINEILSSIPSNRVQATVLSGEDYAKRTLSLFIVNSLEYYEELRNNPSKHGQAGLSPYLHFGQISALRIALELRYILEKMNLPLHIVESSKMPQATPEQSKIKSSVDALLEELIVRKELADNFCEYNESCDSIKGAPQWAQNTLKAHANDARDYVYSYEQLENAKTHDDIWNFAQEQLTTTGKMHGYLRMYWAKKVLEWTESPEQAVQFLIRLNDFYSLDGGDPNGYVGILWSVAGLHDRAWFDRPVFGLVRYMGYASLKKKLLH